MQFSRTAAPETSKGPALLAFMQHNKWRKIAILSSTESIWFETRQDIVKQLETASIDVFKPAAFEPGNVTDAMLSEIRRSGFRIVFVLSNDNDAETLASLACRESMATGWAWLVSHSVSAIAGWLWFRPFLASNMQAFAKQVSEYSMSHFNISVLPDSVDLGYSVALYDAIMLYAYAATKVLSEGGDLQDGAGITEAVRTTAVEGAGGTLVALNSDGDRIESYEVMNYVLEMGDVLSSAAVGVFNNTLKQYKAYERAVVWPGNSTLVPIDYVPGDDACRALCCISVCISIRCGGYYNNAYKNARSGIRTTAYAPVCKQVSAIVQ